MCKDIHSSDRNIPCYNDISWDVEKKNNYTMVYVIWKLTPLPNLIVHFAKVPAVLEQGQVSTFQPCEN